MLIQVIYIDCIPALEQALSFVAWAIINKNLSFKGVLFLNNLRLRRGGNSHIGQLKVLLLLVILLFQDVSL